MVYDDVRSCTHVDPRPGALCSIANAPYHYRPTLWLGALFTALYGLLFLVHLVFALWPRRFHRGGFMLLAVVCAGGELGGWVCRLYSHFYLFQSHPYIAQLVMLIISPIFVSAANYVALERIQFSVGPELARISSKVYIGIFVTGDIISLIIQAAGGGISATSDSSSGVSAGSNLALAGVIIQVLITGPFAMLLTDFLLQHYRYARKYPGNPLTERWTKGVVLIGLTSFVSTMFILIRCIYRCVEMKQGWTGELQTHEVWFPIFDGTMIFFALAVFAVFHPSFLLPAPWAERAQHMNRDLEDCTETVASAGQDANDASIKAEVEAAEKDTPYHYTAL